MDRAAAIAVIGGTLAARSRFLKFEGALRALRIEGHHMAHPRVPGHRPEGARPPDQPACLGADPVNAPPTRWSGSGDAVTGMPHCWAYNDGI